MDILNERRTVDHFINYFKGKFPLIELYKETNQDPDWHAEGNVHIHTDMVLYHAYDLIERFSLNSERSIQLILAALFHDYGKPLVTKIINLKGLDRVCAPDHESIGASLLFFVDPPFGLSSSQWRVVLELIAYHHIPKLLVVKNKLKPDYYKLSRQVQDIELLYLLELSDMMGRKCKDKMDQIEIIELFKLYSMDFGIWLKNPYDNLSNMVKKEFPNLSKLRSFFVEEKIKSRYEDGQFYQFEEELSKAYGYKDSQSHLVIMCGLPGSGKTTYVKEHYSDYEIVSLDSIRLSLFGNMSEQSNNSKVVRVAREEIKSLLRKGKNIVYDATNFRKDFREKISEIGFNYNAFVEIVVVHTSESKSILRNRKRDRFVSENIIENQVNKFQIPSLEESHTLTFVD